MPQCSRCKTKGLACVYGEGRPKLQSSQLQATRDAESNGSKPLPTDQTYLSDQSWELSRIEVPHGTIPEGDAFLASLMWSNDYPLDLPIADDMHLSSFSLQQNNDFRMGNYKILSRYWEILMDKYQVKWLASLNLSQSTTLHAPTLFRQ